jgi:hypothetical protein
MDDQVLCDRCVSVVSAATARLVADYVSLYVAQRTGRRPAVGELVSSSRELPVPISLSFTTLAEQIMCEATTFAEPLAERLGIEWSPVGRPGFQLQRSVDLLASSTAVLVQLSTFAARLWGDQGWFAVVELDGVDAGLRLLSLHRAAQAALGLTRAVVELPALCPSCGTGQLVRVAGSDGVSCQRCGRVLSELDYRRLTIVLARERRTE